MRACGRSAGAVISYHGETGDRRAVMVSDFVKRATLRRTGLFDYFWRPFAIDRAMGTRIDHMPFPTDLFPR